MQSTFSYTAYSDEDLSKLSGLMPNGTYDFVVTSAVAKISKNGNPMIEVNLTVYDKENIPHSIKDYLVSSSNMAWKLKRFCEAIGALDVYLRGEFNELHCINKKGVAKIIIAKGEPKEDGSFYNDRNTVKEYIKSSNLKAVTTTPIDDLPF